MIHINRSNRSRLGYKLHRRLKSRRGEHGFSAKHNDAMTHTNAAALWAFSFFLDRSLLFTHCNTTQLQRTPQTARHLPCNFNFPSIHCMQLRDEMYISGLVGCWRARFSGVTRFGSSELFFSSFCFLRSRAHGLFGYNKKLLTVCCTTADCRLAFPNV